MNDHEKRAWKQLRDMGASVGQIGGKACLDVTACWDFIQDDQTNLEQFLWAFVEVVGRSGTVSRQQNSYGIPTYVLSSIPIEEVETI